VIDHERFALVDQMAWLCLHVPTSCVSGSIGDGVEAGSMDCILNRQTVGERDGDWSAWDAVYDCSPSILPYLKGESSLTR